MIEATYGGMKRPWVPSNYEGDGAIPAMTRRVLVGVLAMGLVLGPASSGAQEAPFSGLHLHVEQDEFAKLFRVGGDQNYTMGLGVQVTGKWLRNVGHLQYGLDRLLEWVLPAVRLTPDTTFDETFHSLMLVGSAFTPDSILAAEPVVGDRPYASLLGLVFGRTWVDGAPPSNDRYAVTTELGIGVLGLNVSRDIQTAIHRLLDTDEPLGWSHQISHGGELTGFYHVGMRRRLTPFFQADTKKTFEASLDTDLWLGYYTNASLGMTIRQGGFYSRYFEFASAPIAGVAQALNAAQGKNEWFAFASIRGRAVGYNALLQGGFSRDSSYTLSSSQIKRLLLEFELGAHGLVTLCEHYSLYATWVALASRSPEFDTEFSRRHWWGSVQLGITHSTR